KAAPPTRSLVVSNFAALLFLLENAMNRSTSAITSGPMPSPGSSRRLWVVAIGPGPLDLGYLGSPIASRSAGGGQLFERACLFAAGCCRLWGRSPVAIRVWVD